jgi:multisubunit Na+/H+ antiporter MnhF subunit
VAGAEAFHALAPKSVKKNILRISPEPRAHLFHSDSGSDNTKQTDPGRLINTILNTVHCNMIDTWLFAAVCLILLAMCAVLRIFMSGPSPDDRVVAMNAAITIAAGSVLGLGISWGNLFILNIFIVLIALLYGGLYIMARYRNGEKA